MGNLLASVRSSATALDALQRSVNTIQNNVSNASTPGYAKQSMTLKAVEFDPEGGLAGGVVAGGLASARDKFAEAAVRAQVSILGAADQASRQLSWIESTFNLNDKAGIASAMNKLFSAFTSWSLSPSSLSEKENVYAAAGDLATAFNRTAETLQESARDARRELESTLTSIDTIAERIRIFNAGIRTGGTSDAGLDARVHSDLEDLAQLVNFHALWQPDGTVTILAGGQAALVVGDKRFSMTASFNTTDPAPAYPDALSPAVITNDSGVDVTASLNGGKLGSLIDFRNNKLGEYLGTSQSEGALNALAETVAKRINEILAAGYPPPGPPMDLFILGSSPVAVAQALKVNPTLAPALLQATDLSTNPPQVNGVALRLSKLANPSDPADMLGGLSYVGALGKLTAKAGRDYAEAKQERDSRLQLATQARNLRAAISGVSLDEEAVRLVEFQRAYQASARMVTALDEILEMTVNLGRV